MEFKEGEITITIPGSDHPEHTKRYMSFLTRMANKGLDNPAYQLHTLSIVCTGKSFIELITRSTAGTEHMIQAARALAEGLLDVVVQSGDSSGVTLDEMLNRMGEQGPPNGE